MLSSTISEWNGSSRNFALGIVFRLLGIMLKAMASISAVIALRKPEPFLPPLLVPMFSFSGSKGSRVPLLERTLTIAPFAVFPLFASKEEKPEISFFAYGEFDRKELEIVSFLNVIFFLMVYLITSIVQLINLADAICCWKVMFGSSVRTSLNCFAVNCSSKDFSKGIFVCKKITSHIELQRKKKTNIWNFAGIEGAY